MKTLVLKINLTFGFLFIGLCLTLFGASAARAQSALDGFDPNVNGTVFAVVVQLNGKILIGGAFTTVSPNGGAAVTRKQIARLERDDRVDQTFNLNTVGNEVDAIAVQPDGKIITGGNFTNILGTARNYIARLNTDGTLDLSFDPNANRPVRAIVAQPDGKILVGGDFSIIGGQSRNSMARLDATTGLADSFDPNADFAVFPIAVQSDGKILAGGFFTSIGGQSRSPFARLTNDTAARSTLTVIRTAVTLTRDGSAPQFARVIFEQSTDNGVTYTLLGNGTSSFAAPQSETIKKGDVQFAPSAPQASAYTLTGLNLPGGQNILIRARGFYRTGYQNGSETIEDKVQNAFLSAPTAANITISGRVLDGKGRGLANARVYLMTLREKTIVVPTNSFGYFRFTDVGAGHTVIITVVSKRYRFTPQVVSVAEDITDLNFTAQ